MAESITIRVQSPDGMIKVSATKRDTAAAFLKKVAKEFGFSTNGFSVYQNRNKTGEITSQSKSLSLLKIKHGDMLYLFPLAAPGPSGEIMDVAAPPSTSSTSSSSLSRPQSSLSRPQTTTQITEDEIDQYLAKQDGKIYRNQDPQLCRHGSMGKCVHCVPLEPFDEDYLNHLDPPVKHMSFHAYIRKLTGGADKKCAAYLTLHAGVIHFKQLHLHIEAQGTDFCGIGETRPLNDSLSIVLQIATQNSLELVDDPKAGAVEEIAAKLGLRKVGWIFTDLLSEDTRIGTVRYSRNKDSYFLSAEECITAGDFQNKHPNTCRLSPDGDFGSKFVTVVATGGPDNQVHFEGYQVSNQCMALVRDECLLPCRDVPELGYAKESSTEQYVPDVFYKDKDKFGNDITYLARPLPVEYLIIDITTTFPKDPAYTFTSTQRFSIENRDVLGETQDFHSLATYLSQNTSTVFLNIVSDFHLLLFLVTNEVMPLGDSIGLLLDAVKTSNEELAQTWRKSEQWATIEQLCSTVGGQSSGLPDYGAMGGPANPTSSSSMWSCRHCTFMNQPGTEQLKRRRQQSEWDYRVNAEKLSLKGCANLTTVLDNRKLAIMTQVKDLLLHEHHTVLPDYGRIQPLSDALGDLFKEFNTLKERLGELTTKFNGIEGFVDDMRAGRGSSPPRQKRPPQPKGPTIRKRVVVQRLKKPVKKPEA
ncbi:UNVERIFIED_CONTAM: hypothetical protein FKN15_059894 [Acipenser sinensis]